MTGLPLDPDSVLSADFPRSEGQTVQLKDGRVLGYIEYASSGSGTEPVQPGAAATGGAGDGPSTSTTSTRAVVLIPGTPGTRFFVHPDVNQLGYVPGVRLLVLERSVVAVRRAVPRHDGQGLQLCPARQYYDTLRVKATLRL